MNLRTTSVSAKAVLALLSISLLVFSCKKDELEGTAHTVPQNVSMKVDISTNDAEEVAVNFAKVQYYLKHQNLPAPSFSRGANKKAPLTGFIEKATDKIITIPDRNNSPAMYVITYKPSGYTIVSATRKESPVLGYSETGKFNFENVPYALAEWFIARAEKIEVLKARKEIKAPADVKDQWNMLYPPKMIPIDDEVVISAGSVQQQKGPLLQTKWGQGVRYNDLLASKNCSNYSNGRPPVGCVATAVAQVMRYHEHPTSYNWSIMPNRLYSWQTANNNSLEVAKLMKNIGGAIGMNYSCTGSGAKTSNARNALVSKFGYSSSAKYVNYNVYSIYAELNNSRPVILDGYHTKYKTGWWIFKKTRYKDGHAWVVDGYKRTLYKFIHNPGTIYQSTSTKSGPFYFHMNWGWNGASMGSSNNNGWFKYNDFKINGFTLKGTAANFQHKKRMIIGIKKP